MHLVTTHNNGTKYKGGMQYLYLVNHVVGFFSIMCLKFTLKCSRVHEGRVKVKLIDIDLENMYKCAVL